VSVQGKKARLEEAISIYEEGVVLKIGLLRRACIWGLFFQVGVPVFAALLVWRFSNVAAAIGVAGVGTVNVLERFGSGGAVPKLIKDCREGTYKFRLSVKMLRMELAQCSATNDTCLEDVKASLREYNDALDLEPSE